MFAFARDLNLESLIFSAAQAAAGEFAVRLDGI